MASTHIDIETVPWTVGTAFCGPDAIFEGKEIVQVKMLSDRRSEGGRGTKTGQPARSSGGYTLNPKGQPHSAFIGQEIVGLVVYSGELDEVHSLEVVDIEPAGGTGA